MMLWLNTDISDQQSVFQRPELNLTPESCNELSYENIGFHQVLLGVKGWVWEV